MNLKLQNNVFIKYQHLNYHKIPNYLNIFPVKYNKAKKDRQVLPYAHS
jgi:hypothetical protein